MDLLLENKLLSTIKYLYQFIISKFKKLHKTNISLVTEVTDISLEKVQQDNDLILYQQIREASMTVIDCFRKKINKTTLKYCALRLAMWKKRAIVFNHENEVPFKNHVMTTGVALSVNKLNLDKIMKNFLLAVKEHGDIDYIPKIKLSLLVGKALKVLLKGNAASFIRYK